MYRQLSEPIEVWARFQAGRPRIVRLFFRRQGRLFQVRQVHFYHTEQRGEALIHHLSVTAAPVSLSAGLPARPRPVGPLRCFELSFNAKKLSWLLEKLYEPE